MKVCNKCSSEKPLTDFSVRLSSPDGRRNECKTCKAIADSTSRKERLQKEEGREKEVQRLRKIASNRTEEEKDVIRKKQKDRARVLAQIEKEAFYREHGCTKQELKYAEDGIIFISDSLNENGDKYNYSEVKYAGTHAHVKIWCNKHSNYFYQTPKDHKNGRGCPLCGNESTGEALRKSHEDFIKGAEDYCGEMYTFGNVSYISFSHHINVTCKSHGDFKIKPGNLMSGKGCPSCAKYGYRKNIPGSLYLLDNGELVKVGITNGDVASRVKQINKSGKNFTITAHYLFENGAEAANLETALLSELRGVYPQPDEKFDGSTECFYEVSAQDLVRMINQFRTNIESC